MDTNKVHYMLRQISDDLREYNDKPMAIEEESICHFRVVDSWIVGDDRMEKCKGSGTDKGEQS